MYRVSGSVGTGTDMCRERTGRVWMAHCGPHEDCPRGDGLSRSVWDIGDWIEGCGTFVVTKGEGEGALGSN